MTQTDPIAALVRWARQYKPQSLLWIGADDHPALGQLREVAATVTPVTPARWHEIGERTFDIAVVFAALEALPRSDAGRLVARVRDVCARRTMVAVPAGGAWQRNDLFAYGFQQFLRDGDSDEAIHLYRFDLFDYKPVPEWLNSKNWAHPELWDKHRW